MNVNHLKAFHAVAKAKSFTLAAKELNVSQPTLSMQVKSLEQELAVPLVKRNRRKFELTEEGTIIFGHAEKIFEMIKEMKRELETFETHNMIIGSTLYISNHVLPEILLAIKEQNTGVKVQIFTSLSREILDRVVNYDYHLAVLARSPYPDNIVAIPVLKAKILFISKEDMGPEVSLRQLADHPIILPEKGSVTRGYLINEFNKRNLTITNPIDCQSPNAIRQMVELGIGGAFFPHFSIQKDIQEGRFHMSSVEEGLFIDYDLIFLQDRRNSQSVRIFKDALNKIKHNFSS